MKVTITKVCNAAVLAVALLSTLPYLASCEKPPTLEESQQKIYDILHTNEEIQKFLNTCEKNGGIRELTASPIGARGVRTLSILCMNGTQAKVDQYK